jgi:hypothetical protein
MFVFKGVNFCAYRDWGRGNPPGEVNGEHAADGIGPSDERQVEN